MDVPLYQHRVLELHRLQQDTQWEHVRDREPSILFGLYSILFGILSILFYLISITNYLVSGIFYWVSILFYLVSGIFYLVSIIFYLVSIILYLLSIIFYLVSTNFFLVSIVFWMSWNTCIYITLNRIEGPEGWSLVTCLCHMVGCSRENCPQVLLSHPSYSTPT